MSVLGVVYAMTVCIPLSYGYGLMLRMLDQRSRTSFNVALPFVVGTATAFMAWTPLVPDAVNHVAAVIFWIVVSDARRGYDGDYPWKCLATLCVGCAAGIAAQLPASASTNARRH